jgi:Abnormal spindle-like microcephaly-assoc'd, ASPM-SPD-2-Hydin/Low-density lipoprotein receptor repeat class B
VKRLASISALALALAAVWLFTAQAGAAVYWTDYSAGTVGRVGADGSSPNADFIKGANKAAGLAVDGAHVYWTNHDGNSIGRADHDGGAPNQSFITGATEPLGVAVNDQYVYWVNTGTTALGIANLAGAGADPSFLGAGYPMWVALDHDHVYWADAATSSIGRANVDGSDPNPEFITGANSPNGVAVDAQHVYWVNAGSSTIGRATLDGGGVNQSFIEGLSYPLAVAVDGQHIYWTNSGMRTIGRAELSGKNASQYFVSLGASPYGVAADPLPTGNASPNTDSLAFGPHEVGAAAPAQTLTITNSGAGDLQLEDIGANDADFAVSADGCTDTTLATGDSCSLDVSFTASSEGARSANLTLHSNDSAGALQVSLSGTGAVASGPSGASGQSATPPGAAKPASPASPAARRFGVKCAVARKRKRGVACHVTLASTVDAPLRWRLVRKGHVVQRGVARAHDGAALIRLSHPDRRPPSGRYLLRIAGQPQAAAIVFPRRGGSK